MGASALLAPEGVPEAGQGQSDGERQQPVERMREKRHQECGSGPDGDQQGSPPDAGRPGECGGGDGHDRFARFESPWPNAADDSNLGSDVVTGHPHTM